MKSDFVCNETLRDLYGIIGYNADMTNEEAVELYDGNFNAVCVETCLLFVVAACAAAVENLFDWFRVDVSRMIDGERYGHTGWYVNAARRFQYQDGDGTDYQLDVTTGEYAVEDADARIIKHASCEESGFGVRLKVAKEEDGALAPLTSDEKSAFESYINRLKPAGVPVHVISRQADVLKLKMAVYYDPIIFSGATASDRVKSVIGAYLKDIEFDGEFVGMDMVDRLQEVPGIEIAEVLEAWFKHAGYDYARMENDVRHIPDAGYMVLADDSDLEINVFSR